MPRPYNNARNRRRAAYLAAKSSIRGGYITGRRKGYRTVARSRGPMATGEMKYYDSSLLAGNVQFSTDWTGTELDPSTTSCLFVPGQGSQINQRIGRKVKVMKLKMRGVITCVSQSDQTGADSASLIRLVVVQDTQTNGTQMQGENVFGELSVDTNSAVTWFSNPDNFGRFKILKDKMFNLENPSMAYDGTNIEQSGLARYFKFNINFKKPVVVNFNATNGGTVADIVDNSFHVIAVATATGIAPTLSYMCRVSYKE